MRHCKLANLQPPERLDPFLRMHSALALLGRGGNYPKQAGLIVNWSTSSAQNFQSLFYDIAFRIITDFQGKRVEEYLQLEIKPFDVQQVKHWTSYCRYLTGGPVPVLLDQKGETNSQKTLQTWDIENRMDYFCSAFSFVLKNTARIANAVQVTLWLSVNHLNRCLCSHCSQCLLVSTSVQGHSLMLPRLWLLVGSDQGTDRQTDRQCHLLSCPA